MDISDEKEFYELMRNLSRGLKKHGMKKVMRALKQINIDSETERHFAIIDFVENAVCVKLGIPRDELFVFIKRGEITIARKLCILIIRKHIKDISDEELGGHYERSRQVVHNAEKEFRTLIIGKKNKFDQDFLAIYNDLDEETGAFIKTLKISSK